jgi:hypothetical protein
MRQAEMWMWWNLCMWFGVGADAARSKQAAAVSGHSRAGARQLLGGSDQHTQGRCRGSAASRLPTEHRRVQPCIKSGQRVSASGKGTAHPDNTIADFRDPLEILGLHWP